MQAFGVIVLLTYGGLVAAGIGYVLLHYFGLPVNGVMLGIGTVVVVGLFYISTLDKVEGRFAPLVSAIGSAVSGLMSALGYLIILFFIVGIPLVIFSIMPPIQMSTTHALLAIIILL